MEVIEDYNTFKHDSILSPYRNKAIQQGHIEELSLHCVALHTLMSELYTKTTWVEGVANLDTMMHLISTKYVVAARSAVLHEYLEVCYTLECIGKELYRVIYTTDMSEHYHSKWCTINLKVIKLTKEVLRNILN